MPFKPGEQTWYEQFGSCQDTKHYVHIEHQKPFVNDRPGELLCDIGAILSVMPKPLAKVLDAGCAGGFLSNCLSLCGYEVTGIDICNSVIEENKKREYIWNGKKSTATFECLDYDELPSEMYDVVIFNQSLHHATCHYRTISSVYRALKFGGIMIANEPGILHTSAKDSKQHAAKYNVTEKSTIPFRILTMGLQIGFSSFKVYPNSNTLFKLIYNNGKLANHSFLSKVFSVLPGGVIAILAKYLHGMTVLTK